MTYKSPPNQLINAPAKGQGQLVATYNQAFAYDVALKWRFVASLVAGAIGAAMFGVGGFVGFAAIAGVIALGFGYWRGLNRANSNEENAMAQETVRQGEQAEAIEFARAAGAFDRWEKQ